MAADVPPVDQCSAYVQIVAGQKQSSELALAAAQVRIQQLEKQLAEAQAKAAK